MLNQVVLVGRLKANPTLTETNDGEKKGHGIIAIPTQTKDADGEYGTNIAQFQTPGNIAESMVEYCSKGDLIGIKGRIEHYETKDEEGTKYIPIIVAEKVTFLSREDRKAVKEEKKDEE